MMRPGTRLRVLAQRVCSASAMERLVDPAIADLQHEYEEAVRHGLVWRRRRVLIAGYAAFARVTALAVIGRVLHTRIVADDRSVIRTLLFSLAAVTLLTVLFLAPPLGTFASRGPGQMTMLVVYLVPQAVAVALPLGLVFGVLLGLRNRPATTPVKRTIALLGIGCTVAAFVLVGLLMPAANQRFRELAAADGIPKPIARGYNELTLDELASGDLGRMGHVINVEPQRLAGEFQFRLALSFAPMALSLLALGIAARRRGAQGPIVASLAALTIAFAYYTLLYYARQAMVNQLAPAAIAGWAPNLLCIAAALLLRRVRLKPDTTEDSATPISSVVR